MQSSYPHMHSLIVDDAHAHLTNTRYVTFQNSRPGVIYLHAGKQEESFARIVFDVSETSMGFHLFHTCKQKEVLLYSYNLGAPSVISAMYAFAHEAEVRKPKDIDAWVVRNVAQAAGRIKKVANLLLELHREKDTVIVLDIIGAISEGLGLTLDPYVAPMYMLIHDEPDLNDMEDLSEDFFSDLDRSNRAVKMKPIATVPVPEEEEEDEDEEPDAFPAEFESKISDYDLLDKLNTLSTEVLFGVYHAAFGEGAFRSLKNTNHPARKMRNKLIDGIVEDNAAHDLILLCEMSDDDDVFAVAAILRK